MFLTVIKVKEFDTNVHGVDTEYVYKVKEKSKDIIKWLYLTASNNPSISPVLTAPVNNRGIKNTLKE